MTPSQSSSEEQLLHKMSCISTALSAERCTPDWCSRSLAFAKAVRNQMLPSCVEWWWKRDNQATVHFGYCRS